MNKTLYIPIDTTIFDVVECPKLVKRGDTLRLQIKVFTDGALRDLTGQNIDIILQKSDGTLIENTIDVANISNGVVTAILDIQATVIAGLVSGELQLSDEEGQESTNTFTFEVNSSLADDVLEVSKDDINTLNQLRDLIATGEATIAEYETHILAIANSIEAVEALENIKSYIDVNLLALQQENAEAVVNIANETTQNNQAVQNIADLTAKNATATSNISALDAKNSTASSNITSLDAKNATATSNISALDSKNGTASTNIANLDTKNTTATSNISNLDSENDRAETNISALESFGDATTLLQDTTALKSEIQTARDGEANLGARLDKVDTSLSDMENPTYLNKWFSGGIKGKKIVIVGDSTSEQAYGLHRALSYYQRHGGELEGVGILNFGQGGRTLAEWNADAGRYGKAETIAQKADLYIFCYGINDCRLSALTEDQFVTLLGGAIDDLIAGAPNSTILLRMPNTFTISNTSGYNFINPQTPEGAQSISTLLRNAYIRVAKSRKLALLDTQALVYGLTSKLDSESPYMLNQIHPNDLGNYAVAREIVKMIGVPATIPPVIFSMDGKVGIGTIGTYTFKNEGIFRYGYASCRSNLNGGTLTIEFRKIPVGGGDGTVLGLVTYTGGTGSANTITPQASLLNYTTLIAGETIKVSVTSCTMDTYDLTVYTIVDENSQKAIYPLQLRGNGLVSSLDSSVVFPATEGFSSEMERSILSLKAIKFKKRGANRFINWSQDATKSVWVKSNVTVTGNAGSQTLTSITADGVCGLNAPVVPGETLTFSWQASYTSGLPKYAIYDLTNASFVVNITNYPNADTNGWRHATFTVPQGCTTIRCYPLAQSVNAGDAINLTGMQLSEGTSMKPYAPTNHVGTGMVVNTGALPTEFTLINFVKVDSASGIAVVCPGINTDGNPTLQAENNSKFGYPIITTRGTVNRGSFGTWQSAVLRVGGGSVFATINDQAESTAFLKDVNISSLRWNYLNESDSTGDNQLWDGEVIGFYFPYVLTRGEVTAFIRKILRTLQAGGESITEDWGIDKLK